MPTKAYSYSDVWMKPNYSTVLTRSSVDTQVYFGERFFKVPVTPANMVTCISEEKAKWLSENGYFYVMHRFLPGGTRAIFDFCERAKDWKTVSISIGVKEADVALVHALPKTRCDYITIDIAHGHSIHVYEMIKLIRDVYGAHGLKPPFIIAGNVATGEGALDLCKWGADAVKVGIGGGCFAAGTRILMEDGTYKNIENVMVNDRVISGDGSATRVIGVRASGRQGVMEYRHARFHLPTTCTHDHLHFISKTSHYGAATIGSSNLAKLAEKAPDFYQWERASSITKLDSLLLPKNIRFKTNESFNVDLNVYLESNKTNKALKSEVLPSYELGYLIGAFLGDGYAGTTVSDRTVIKKDGAKLETQNTSHKLTFYFGLNEDEIANKTAECFKAVFEVEAKIEKPSGKNITQVTVYACFLSRFFQEFYNTYGEKFLPHKFLCSDKKYLEGVLDGFYDSDGSRKGTGRTYNNTSSSLMESIGVVCYLAKGFWPSYGTRRKSIGKLKGCNLDNCKQPYAIYYSPMDERNGVNNDFFVFKPLELKELNLNVETYDIEVEHESHSFVANNAIVHNSACSTKDHCGFHVPMWTCVDECVKAIREKYPEKSIIADGGIRENGDIAKALAAGADLVMAGSIFASCEDAPGETIEKDGKKFKVYYGSASARNKGYKKHVEGVELQLPCNGMTYEEKLEEIKQDLQSAVSYAGGYHLGALRGVEKVFV